MSIPRLYRLSQRTIVTTAGAACWEIIAPPTQKIRLLELELRQVTAVAGSYGVGKPAAIGVTPTTPVVFEADKAVGSPIAALTTGAVAWGTGPTVPAKFRFRTTCAAVIGDGFSLDFSDEDETGIEIAAGSSFVIWVVATAPVCDVTALILEQS